MKTYSKIDTLFERDDRFNLTPNYRNKAIPTICKWIVTEKVDGMNIRISLTPENEIKIGGRTDAAQIPADLYEYLYKEFTIEKMKTLRKGEDAVEITLFGEGYGAGIQSGGKYGANKSFILFDVLVADTYWLKDEAVTEIAEKLEIKRAPILGIMSLDEIVELVKNKLQSKLKDDVAEGVVARPLEPLFNAKGERLIIKLKVKDFDIK